MVKRTTSSDRVILDPIFSIPDGAEDTFEYNKELDDVEFSEGDVFDYIEEDDEEEEYGLATPTEFSIVEQKIRRAPGGQQVVDIVLEIEDIDGATNYEVQVTKV